MGVELLSRAVSRGPSRVPSRGPGDGVGNIITSIFADGTDGFYFDFSKTDRLFQSTAETLADDAGENIGLALESHSTLWGSQSFAAFLAGQAEQIVNGDGSSTSGWTAGANHTLSVSGGKLRVTSTATGYSYQSFATVVGRWYRFGGSLAYVSGDVSFKGIRKADNTTASVNVVTASTSSNTSPSEIYTYFQATATTTYIILQVNGAAVADFDNITLKAIPGNHAYQATTAAQPKYQTGGLARFDGLDDNQLTPLVPGTVMTLMAKVKPTAAAATRIAAGANANSYIGFDASGRPIAKWGSTGTSLGGTGASRDGVFSTLALVSDGVDASLYVNGTVFASGSFGGLLPATGIYLGALGASFPLPGDIPYSLAIKKALTAAQIAAITNLWGTS